MSVLVKDMRFPNYCSDCEFSKPWGNSGTYCSRYPWKDDVKYGESKPDWCPLGDVPTPHGRLGDLDALAAQCDDPHWCVWLNEIEDAPTIIEAEE